MPRWGELPRNTSFERGRYLASIVCTACHGLDFKGSAFESSPPLAIVVRYSAEQFRRLLRTGKPVDGRDIAAMGWMPDVDFTDQEFAGLYVFLRAYHGLDTGSSAAGYFALKRTFRRSRFEADSVDVRRMRLNPSGSQRRNASTTPIPRRCASGAAIDSSCSAAMRARRRRSSRRNCASAASVTSPCANSSVSSAWLKSLSRKSSSACSMKYRWIGPSGEPVEVARHARANAIAGQELDQSHAVEHQQMLKALGPRQAVFGRDLGHGPAVERAYRHQQQLLVTHDLGFLLDRQRPQRGHLIGRLGQQFRQGIAQQTRDPGQPLHREALVREHAFHAGFG